MQNVRTYYVLASIILPRVATLMMKHQIKKITQDSQPTSKIALFYSHQIHPLLVLSEVTSVLKSTEKDA
jgi:hypothetical protein